MAESLKEPCTACAGAGTVPHVKRKMGTGEPDPTDFRVFDLCEKCDGSGKVIANKAVVTEHKPGNVADTFAG